MIYSNGSVIGTFSPGEGASGGSKSRVIVNGDSDLPPVVDGFSTLAADTEYFFQNNVTFSKNLRSNQTGVSLLGTGPFNSTCTFTGTGDILTIDDVSVSADKWNVNIGTGTQFVNGTGTTNSTLFMDSCSFNGAGKLGTLNGLTIVLNNFVGLLNSDGWTFTGGPFRGVTLVNCFMVDDFQPASTAVHFRLQNATFLDFEIQNIVLDGTGTCFSSSVGGTANMSGDVEADVIGATLGQGFMTFFSGFGNDFQTNKWKFRDNSPITLVEDSKYEVDHFLTTANTVGVSVQGTFYEISTPGSGAWGSDIAKHFTTSADGFITYTGDRPIDVEVIGTTTVEKVGGGSDELEVRIAVNWTAGDTGLLKSKAITRNTNPTAVTTTAQTTIQPNDTIRLIYANNGGTSDITVSVAKLDIIGR